MIRGRYGRKYRARERRKCRGNKNQINDGGGTRVGEVGGFIN